MMRRLITVSIVLALVGGAAFWWLTRPDRIDAAALGSHTPNAENGRIVFFASGCASCHVTEGLTDRTRLGGGHGLRSPFGTFYAPNISPHAERGIGRWTEADFVTAMVKGTSPAGDHYYPAFPYTSYQRMTVPDIRDLFAYLKTLPADETANRPHDVGFPFNVRRGLGLWKLAFLDGQPFRPDPARSAEWNRGAYLVEGPGHCAECHSTRDWTGAIAADRRYAGGPNPDGRGWVPNITPHRDGLAEWEAGDIAAFLSDGLTPTGDSTGGTMAAVIRNTSQLPDADRAAMAAYLKSLPQRAGRRPPRS
ncbi:c-type cytochrome [Phreatobacter sp.]|uniref:c-type cytochrome n=1 Tax=Phreatobacter sp. TaxID=1966341 RepID=UPI003F6F16EC